MKELIVCPKCLEKLRGMFVDDLPYCGECGCWGFFRRVWWASGIPGFFKSR